MSLSIQEEVEAAVSDVRPLVAQISWHMGRASPGPARGDLAATPAAHVSSSHPRHHSTHHSEVAPASSPQDVVQRATAANFAGNSAGNLGDADDTDQRGPAAVSAAAEEGGGDSLPMIADEATVHMVTQDGEQYVVAYRPAGGAGCFVRLVPGPEAEFGSLDAVLHSGSSAFRGAFALALAGKLEALADDDDALLTTANNESESL
jgi:hypothetical protein